MSEIELYPEILQWFQTYLEDKYQGWQVETTDETSRRYLDEILYQKNINVPESTGVRIKVDIVGIITKKNKQPQLAFIEVKNTTLTLKDLGQLWGYTKLINPVESFLISSAGVGSLESIINHYNRHDILRYGSKNEKMMKIARWDVYRKSIDYSTLLPRF